MGRLDNFIKENPNTYKLYNATRHLLEPYLSETIMDALRIEYLTTECGEYFASLLYHAEKEHFLDTFAPDEIALMTFWIAIAPSNDFGDRDPEIKRLCNEYYKLTGKKVPNPTGIPENGY